jgi:hypothetical protein
MLHHSRVALLRRLVQPPERQACKKNQRCPDAVVPLGLINTCLHTTCFFAHKGTKKLEERQKFSYFLE